MARSGVAREDLFFRLAIADLQGAADLFRPIHDRTAGVDGWVPINVTLLFSREQYIAAAEAYMRGLERRIASGLSLDVRSVASLFVSRWDKATMDKLPDNLRDRLRIAIAQSTYAAYRDLLDSERWQRLENWGARTQRLPFASTGTKDPRAPDTLYIGALAAPNTINTIPEETLAHFADHGEVGGVLARDGGRANETLSAIVKAGVDLGAVSADLQAEGAKSFDESWSDLLKAIETKSRALA